MNQFDTCPPEDRPPLFKKASEDVSPEVREAAANLIFLCPSVFSIFLSDVDPSVRVAVVKHSVSLRSFFPDPKDIFQPLSDLVHDPSSVVRCTLASVLHDHASYFNCESD
jgi:hypothetical protein